ncbi:MAG: hypothetical protein HXX19_05175 [Rhodoferax sp.]|nr:hypothetical protein [Rhodoferax sp.]
MKKAWIAAAVLAACTGAQAQDSNWRIFAGIGYASGGEKITSGTVTNVSTGLVIPYDIQAGTGFQQRLGAEYRLSERITLQASIGHSTSEAMGFDGSYDFTTIPFEFMGFAEIAGGFRIGAGARQSSAELRGTGKAANSPVNGTFVSTQGAVLEVQYLFANPGARPGKPGPQFGLSLRGVNETFSHTLGTLNGNHVEVGAVLYY